MIRKFFPITNAELETRQAKPGMSLMMEILIFLAVYIVASIFESYVLILVACLFLIFDPSVFFTLMDTALRRVEAGSMSSFSKDELMQIFTPFFSKMMLLALFITVSLTVAVFFYCRQIQNRKLPSLGFRRRDALPEYLGGLILGAGMFSLAVLLSGRTITISSANFSIGLLILYFLGYMLQGMSEEVLCRGYFMLSVARRNSILAAILASSVAFGCLHLFNTGFGLIALVNTVLFGVFASIWFLKRGSIWGVAAIHTAWNFVQGSVWGICVSGMPATNSILTTELQGGTFAKLWNGGSYGLEGGLAVTVVLVVFCVIVFFLPANRHELANLQPSES